MARTLIHSTSAFGVDVAFGCYGTCATAAATPAKVVTCSGFTSDMLISGMCIWVKFTYASGHSSSRTLNVNSTGAKSILVMDNYNLWRAGAVIPFIYDGTNWVMGSQGSSYIQEGDGIEITMPDTGSVTVLNRGVRSVATGTSNGTISVNTNGTAANVAVKGLGTAAYKNVLMGTVSMGSGAYVDVAFSTAFSAVPYVVAAYYTTGSQPSGAFGTLKLSTVTKNGFKIMQQGTSGITVTACWIAML